MAEKTDNQERSRAHPQPEMPGAGSVPVSSASYEIAHLRIIPRLHYGRVASAMAVVCVVVGLGYAFSQGDIAWTVVGRYLTAQSILAGVQATIVMACCAMALGIFLGVIFAVMRISTNPVLKSVAVGYIWLFRGAPALLQLLIWFNLAAVFPNMGIPGLFMFKTTDIMTPFVAALLGLGIQQGAYTAEVVRGGLLAVDRGQYEAAQAIGMTRGQMLRRIVMPQAMRVILPPIGNELISMVKLTSLASVIAYSEVLHRAQTVWYANSRVLELLFVASVWYLVVVSILSVGQFFLERHFGRGSGHDVKR